MPRTLYDAIPSANSVRVRILLHEKGLDYQRVTLDLNKKEQKRPEFLRLNPYGKVPVLDDDGKVLFESLIINEYLEEKYPSPSFMPQDPYLRGRIRLLTDYGMNYINEPFTAWRLQIRGKPEDRDPKVVEAAGNAVLERLRYLEGALDEQAFWLARSASPTSLWYPVFVSWTSSACSPPHPYHASVRGSIA